MNKELIISETEQFINDEIFYIQIEYGEKETANERFYLNTAKRLTKAYSLYKKNNIFKNDYILALRDFLITFDVSVRINQDEFLKNNKYGISFDDVECKYFASYQLSFDVNEKFVKEAFLREIQNKKSGNDNDNLTTDPMILNLTGYSKFKSLGQKLAVYGALNTPEGFTTLVSLPTGGGKSLITQTTEDNQIETVYGLSEQALFQTNNLVEGVLKNTADETKIIIKKKKKLVKQISEFDSYLMLDINDKELKNIHKKIKAAEQAIIDDQVKIAELEQRRGAANSRVMTATSEFGKYVEAYLSTAELKDSSDRIIKYSNIALNVIEKYRIELQKRKTNILAATITDCYLKLANKKNLIQTIVMDPESLDLRYLSENGAEVPKDSLSAGEQQLMVISILWALALCSKKKLPVIIDTPLSRLDSLHRTALITTYFPNAGEQTIILSTDSEIDAGYYQLMKENIGDEFTLNYDENSKSTSIERGYLIGAKL